MSDALISLTRGVCEMSTIQTAWPAALRAELRVEVLAHQFGGTGQVSLCSPGGHMAAFWQPHFWQ
jgi:hypothetical protein